MSTTIPHVTGTCNRCGLCCFVDDLRCEYLMDTPATRAGTTAIGEADATGCAVHALRYNGMPIRMLNAAGEAIVEGWCAKGWPFEDISVAKQIGKGCSMVLDGDNDDETST